MPLTRPKKVPTGNLSGLVTATQLHNTLDISGKTVTLPESAVSAHATKLVRGNWLYQNTSSSTNWQATWNLFGASPSIPKGAYIFGCAFLNTEDPDHSDHFDCGLGPAYMSGNTWGTTSPSSTGGDDVCILTHPGDSQDVAFGHYGGWQAFQTRTNTSNGYLYIQQQGQGPSGSHLTIKVLGYFTT